LLKSFKDSYVYTGQYSKHRQKYFGKNLEGNPYHQFVTFAQNHDQVGNRMLGDRLTASLTFESLKLVSAIVLLSPHVPLLFMGEEYGEKNPFQYFVSHTDEKLVELVREGRKKEFSYFKWQGEVPDPQDTQTFIASKLSWAYQEQPHNLLFELYKFLIAFRKERKAMQGYERHHVVTFDLPGRNLIAMERRYGSDALLILFNLDLKPVTFSYPGLTPTVKIFDSSSPPFVLQDSGVPAPVASDAGTVVINPHAAVIFEL
jgi:maltooligosyltrehalose trehalohydrolase